MKAEESDDDPEGYRLWCSQQIGLLVEASPEIPVPFERETIKATLSGFIELVSLSELAQRTNCTRRSIFMWMHGTTLPRIESLCRLCFHLDVSVLSLLRGMEPNASISSAMDLLIPRQRDRRKRQNATIRSNGFLARNADVIYDVSVAPPLRYCQDSKVCVPVIFSECKEVEMGDFSGEPTQLEAGAESSKYLKEVRLRIALENELRSDYLRSAREVAISVGYSSPDRVLKKYPDLCSALSSRFNEQAAKRRVEIRSTLRKSLQQSPPGTLNEIARRLRMSSSSALRLHEPLLCDRVLALRKNWQRKNRERVKVILERALKRNDIPPFRNFCKAAGISVDLAISHFPKQKEAYDTRYRSLMVAKRLQKKSYFQNEVERIVRMLREHNEYPSAERVFNVNPELRVGGWDQIQLAIRRAQRTN